MQIDNLDHIRLNGDAKQHYVADPDRDAEFVTEQLLQDESAREGVNRRDRFFDAPNQLPTVVSPQAFSRKRRSRVEYLLALPV